MLHGKSAFIMLNNRGGRSEFAIATLSSKVREFLFSNSWRNFLIFRLYVFLCLVAQNSKSKTNYPRYLNDISLQRLRPKVALIAENFTIELPRVLYYSRTGIIRNGHSGYECPGKHRSPQLHVKYILV